MFRVQTFCPEEYDLSTHEKKPNSPATANPETYPCNFYYKYLATGIY